MLLPFKSNELSKTATEEGMETWLFKTLFAKDMANKVLSMEKLIPTHDKNDLTY